ncbi:MAG: HEAT repeat domain-containing protein [Deltaproteobacteria bacterium]|nr:HEAT repeat domain-containing protein [Deltaproteobacteria bacterium]
MGVSIGALRVVHSPRGIHGTAAALVVASCLVMCVPGVVLPARADAPAEEKTRDRALVETYGKMLDEDPYQEYALRRLMEVSPAVGGLPALLERYRAAVQAEPQRSEAWAVLGHLALAADRDGEALAAYERAASLEPKAPEPWLAIGRLHRRAQAGTEALAAYDRAVALARGRARRQEVLREAMTAAMELRALDRSEAYATELAATEPRNAYLRMEYATALTQAGHPERALAAWQQSARAAGGDLKLLVVIWKQVGELQEQLGRLDAAEATWREALSKVGAGHWAREAFLEGLVGVYRRKDALAELVDELAPQARRDAAVRLSVARMLEEMGEDRRALELFREVVAARPSDLAWRERIIAILERVGTPDEVIEAWRALVRAAGGEPRYELRLVETLFQRERNAEAFKALAAMGRRYPQDAGVHQAIIDLTMRYGDAAARKKVEREFRTLIALEPRESGHVISLGEFYWTAGERGRAVATWRRLLELEAQPGEGHLALAEVYADHGLDQEASAEFEAAMAADGDDVRAATAYAVWLERRQRPDDALRIWQRVLALAGRAEPPRPADAAEARRRILGLWERAGRLSVETEALEARFNADPTDLETGRSLARAWMWARRYADAQRVLERILASAPDDVGVLAELEEVYTRQNRLAEAIDVLERLARRRPADAPEHYHRAADLALALGDEARALDLARRAVAGNPADPRAHARVGELYLRMGRLGEAAEALRQSLTLDPRASATRFRLAGLYRELGRPLREEQALLEILRASSDPTDLLRAGRSLLQVASRTGRLDALELALRPLLHGQGARPEIILKLLVDLYGEMADRVAWSRATLDEREQAAEHLGDRALEPLLAALSGQDVALRARALQVVRQTRPRGAVAALARLLVEPDLLTGFQAAMALGGIGTPAAREALGRVVELPGRSNDRAEIAIWALGLTRAPDAARWLVPTLGSGPPRRRILGALAVGLTGGEGAAEALAALSAHSHPGVRAAAVWGLAHLGVPEGVPVLARLLRSDLEPLARAAAWGLGRVGTAEAQRALADALWDPESRAPALVAEALLGAAGTPDEADRVELAYLALPDSVRAQLTASAATLLATARPDPPEPASLARALERRRPLLAARIAQLFSAGEATGLRLLLEDVAAAAPTLALVPPSHAALPADAQAVIASLLAPHVESLAALARGQRGPGVRPTALTTLALLARHGLLDAGHLVRSVAMEALDAPVSATRVAAARALASTVAPLTPEPVAALRARLDAAAEPAADARERAAIAAALGALGGDVAASALGRLLVDPVPEVRLAALTALSGPPPVALIDRLTALLDDLAPAIALAALDILGRSDDPRARASIAAATQHVDPRLRRRARALR